MIEAKNGNIDNNYFKDIIQKNEATDYIPDCPRPSEIKVDNITGWILDFFAYDQEGYEVCRDHLKPEDIEKLASQLLIVPFKVCSKNFSVDLKYSVGFFGCDQNEKNEVIPVIGWTVSNCSEKEKNSIQ